MTKLTKAQASSTCSGDEKKEDSGWVDESSNAEYRRHNDEQNTNGANADTQTKNELLAGGVGVNSALYNKSHFVDPPNFSEGHAVASLNDGGIGARTSPSSTMPSKKAVADAHGHQLQQQRIHMDVEGSAKTSVSVCSIPNLDEIRSNKPKDYGQLPDIAHRAWALPAAQPSTTTAVAGMTSCTHVSTIKTERQRKIMASIKHRRKLLTWVRRVRIETQKIRDQYSSGDIEGFIAAILLSKTNNNGNNMQKQHHQLISPTGTMLPTAASAQFNRKGASPGGMVSASREVADFQTVTNMANRTGSIFKRTKSSSTDNSAPRELRRGSSVGKRMATAVSALANEGGSVSITSISTLDNSSAGGGRGPNHPSISPKVALSVPITDSSSQRLTMKHYGKQFQGKQFQNPHLSITQGGGIAPCSTLPAASSKATLDKQKKVKKRSGSLKKAVLGANINGGVSLPLARGESLPQHHHHPGIIVPPKAVAAADRGMLMKGPNHFKAGVSTDSINHPPSRPAMMHHHAVKVLVPSAAAVKLLGRRNMLAARLNSLLRKRHLGQNNPEGFTGAEDTVCDANALVSTKLIPGKLANDGSIAIFAPSPVGVSDSLSASGITEEKVGPQANPWGSSVSGMRKFVDHPPVIPRHPIEQPVVVFQQQDLSMPLSSPRVPPCLKTHWDIVLEEMRWMATDFHEERKWKVSAGKTLSNTIRKTKSRRVKRSESSALLGMLARNRTPVSSSRESPISKSRSKSKSTFASCLSTGSWLSAQNRSNRAGIHSIKDSFYLRPVRKDVDGTRKISRLLSICVLDHWDSCCDGVDLGHGRIEKLKACFASPSHVVVDKVLSSDIRSPWSASMANCNQSTPQYKRPENATCNKILEPGYDEITSRMEKSRQSFSMLKESINIDKLAVSYEGTGMPQLSHGQSRAVHFLERLWKVSMPTTGSSASDSCDKERGINTGPSSSNRKERKSLYDDAYCGGLSAIVGGGLSVGKTVAVGALLWKNRMGGPQLVVCSPGALMRWRHELNKFKGLYGKIYGGHQVGRAGGDMALSHMESDVVLCDYGSFFELAAASLRQCKYSPPVRSIPKVAGNAHNSGRCNYFASLVLDLRHPSSSLPEMDGRENLKNESTAVAFSYVESIKWWIRMNNFVARCCPKDMNRLIIEHTDILSSHQFFYLINDNLGSSRSKDEAVVEVKRDRKRHTQNEMLAMKVAFIFHPSTFINAESCGVSIGKRVILWAKHQAKRLAMSKRSTTMRKKAPLLREEKDKILTEIGHLCNGEMAIASSTSFLGYRHVLETSLRSVYDMIVIDLTTMEQNMNERSETKEHFQKCHPAWELRMCSLSRPQQVAYDQCCSNLIQQPCSLHDHSQIAEYLLKLRKICIHSNLDEIILSFLDSPQKRNKYDERRRLREGNGSNLVRNLAALFSEANVDVAKEVIKKSSKMKELLQLLICECGHDFFARECHELVTENTMRDAKDSTLDEKSTARKKMQKTKKKVLILATLVEAQLLTSLLLSAVGIHHEVLISSSKFAARKTAGVAAASPSDSLHDRYDSKRLPVAYNSSVESTSAWAWSQDVLSQFSCMSGCNVRQSRNHSRLLCHYQSLDIVIASPKAISSQSCGICPSSANMVISIDEDWSGREAPHITSIFSKIRRRRQLLEMQAVASPADSINVLLHLPPSDCRFIKLVCQSTCEDKFLCEGNCRTASFSEQLEARGIKSPLATRSSVCAAALKINKDKNEADDEQNNDHTKLENQILLCPIKAEPKGALFNIEGFLIPPFTGKSKKAKHYSTERHHILVGSNISRYGNNKLCSVLCCTSIESDVLFLPTKGKRNHQDSLTDNSNIAFAWALFNSENDVSSNSETKLSISSIHYLPGSNSGSCSTKLGISTATSCSASAVPSVWYHFISLKRSSSVIAPSSKRKTISLMDHDKKPSKDVGTISSRGALSKSNILSTSNSACRKEIISGDSFDAVLMYMPDFNPTPSKKRKFSVVGLADGKENKGKNDCLLESIYSFCFSSYNCSSSRSVTATIDGNDGCEPLVYFPTFIHSLLHAMQNFVTSDDSVKKNSFSGVKRKEFDLQDDKKRKRSNIQSISQERMAVLFLNNRHHTSFPDDFSSSLQNMNLRYHDDTFEANLHSAKDIVCGNKDFIVPKLSLDPSLRSVSSGQSCCSLKSMILITHKKQPPNNAIGTGGGDVAHSIMLSFDSMQEIDGIGGGKLQGKITRQHDQCVYSSPLACTSYFRNNNFHARCLTIREGLSYNSVASSIGRMRLKCRLNNSGLSSSYSPKSYTWLPFEQATTIQSDGETTSHGTVQGAIYSGFHGTLHDTFPSVDCEESLHHLERSQTWGITLPVGVKTPRFTKNNSGSLRGSFEAWSDMEDFILRESVSRYGSNWQLVARALSSSASFVSVLYAMGCGKEYPGRESLSRCRSPDQCQNRWASIKANKMKATSSSPLNMRSVVSSSIGSPEASVERASSWFVNQEARGKEMVVRDNLSPFNLPQRQPSRISSCHWIARSRQAPKIAPISFKNVPDKSKPLISPSQQIRKVSKKSRHSSIPIPALTPTHSSHSESVQTARANMLAAANGVTPTRHEMWPLELLDYIKKQKVVANRLSHQREILVSSSSSSHHHSVHQSSHQLNSAPYHPPPHNIHPTPHQTYQSGAGQIPHHQPHRQYQGQTMHNAGANKSGVGYQIPQPRVPTRHNHHHHRQPKEMKKGST